MDNCSDQQSSNCNNLLFNCSSDELLWCQLHCICEGCFNGKENRYDSLQSIPQFGSGGTIRQRNYSYRCRAVKGDWQAQSYYTRLDSESEPFKSDYIIQLKSYVVVLKWAYLSYV